MSRNIILEVSEGIFPYPNYNPKKFQSSLDGVLTAPDDRGRCVKSRVQALDGDSFGTGDFEIHIVRDDGRVKKYVYSYIHRLEVVQFLFQYKSVVRYRNPTHLETVGRFANFSEVLKRFGRHGQWQMSAKKEDEHKNNALLWVAALSTPLWARDEDEYNRFWGDIAKKVPFSGSLQTAYFSWDTAEDQTA